MNFGIQINGRKRGGGGENNRVQELCDRRGSRPGRHVPNSKFCFCAASRPQKPLGLLGPVTQDGHLDIHTAPEL